MSFLNVYWYVPSPLSTKVPAVALSTDACVCGVESQAAAPDGHPEGVTLL